MKLAVAFFDGAGRAQEVLTGYRIAQPEEAFWCDNVGVIERHRGGRISIWGDFGLDQSWDEEEGADTAVGFSAGALTGLLIGALAGPAGMAVGGTLGASFGGLLGATAEEEEGPAYDVIRAKLPKGTSALALLADNRYVDKFLAAVKKDARDVYQRDVREELRNRLGEALREAAEYPVPPREPGKPAQPPATH